MTKKYSAGVKTPRKSIYGFKLPLAQLINQSYDSGDIPSKWKLANVSPIFKSGSKGEVSNYTPISLTSSVGKVMERLIKNKLVDFMYKNNIIPSIQHGFTERRNCSTNLLEFYDKVTRYLDGNKSVDAVYLDFRKAFDLVPHEKLIAKMKHFGVDGRLLAWVANWLSERRQRVVIESQASAWAKVTSGVIQGSVLGPVLFLLYVSDIPSCIEPNIFLSMYADDSKLLSEGNTDSLELQTTLDQLSQWTKRNGMAFNVGKCKVVHFGFANKEKNIFY